MSGDTVSIVLEALCGLLVAGMGAYMAASGDVRLLHGYHYSNVPASERPRLARETGAGLIASGVGIGALMMSSSFHPIDSALANACAAAGIVLLLGGIAWALIAIIRRNGALISFNGVPVDVSGASPRMGMLCGGAFGLLIALTCGAPGVYMIATNDVSLLHSYHYEGVAAADIPALALAEGLGMIALAAGVFVCCLAGGRMVARPVPLWSKVLMGIGCAVWIAGLAAMLIAIPVLGGSLT